MNKEPEMYEGKKVYINSEGYKFISPGDWKSNRHRLMIHNLIACKKYCIDEIPEGYVIHHLNMNKLDNSFDNLMLISESDHNKLHNYIRKHSEVLHYSEECTKELLNKIREDIEEKTGDLYEDTKIDLARLLSKRRLYKKDPQYMTTEEIRMLEEKITETRSKISEIRAERAKSRKPMPDKDTLLKDLESFRNFENMADYYGVSSNAIRKWCKKHDIDFHKYSHTQQSAVITKKCPVCGKEFTCTEKQNKTYCSDKCSREKSIVNFDKDEILDMIKDGLSLREIGRFYGVHHNTVIRYLTKNNINYK